ncbi:MAG: hypothetical protein COZ34_00105 [Candidatus Pacebacteria bacterium CG_4_10_14_3_um_filter_34_15]|nr:hypothetical protein [Candidatus Pacearchaeota archaeon]NCQ65723.1 hypothetical protein [Candidatus Paceibacterota bacterium]OIO44723.1 MAG: hypothetical protein AUJ41_01970 [Candidatus Pacebacteria bacterium CG1_02_43_31]PIQ81265.1 MAG: hypothetical protein COV78_01170 [Candidatus Pacebacteria bacterium CG11_big_fil_rev_8_21_14_0_20_34_55]PIX82045.1 MAG: hypothetical protein COZ34_00105 [Candidatus Pacebacteria bacterium CG_4_10_14_3_um_filter_34_15]PJC43739.1 MAG: hypothetical protein CO0
MQRGIVTFTNIELKLLHDLAISHDCKNDDLLDKLSPVASSDASLVPSNDQQTYDVLISADEAEVILDCMPMPDKDDDPDLVTARIKVQQFLAKSRFPESSF